MFHHDSFTIATRGRGTYEVTDHVRAIVRAAAIGQGLCHAFVHHTSAGLILCENADPSVRSDLERFFARLRIFFYAAAGLPQRVFDELQALAVETRGEELLWVTGMGATETAPFALCTGRAGPGPASWAFPPPASS